MAQPVSAAKQQSIARANQQASQIIGKTVATTLKGLQKEVSQRTYRASNELRNVFRLSWGTHVHVEKKGVHFRAVAAIESRERAGGRLLGEMLENGTGKIKPRPYKQKVIDRAMPKITAIYKKPYKP